MGLHRFVLFCSCFLGITVCSPLPSVAQADNPPAFEFGIEAAHFDYQEGDFMQEKGGQYGLYAGYTHFFLDKIMTHLFGSFVGGDLGYEGGLQTENPNTGRPLFIPGTADSPNSIFNLRATGGYRFAAGPVDLTPFGGFGYRLLRNELTDTIDLEGYGLISDPCIGYMRDQSYWYVPLGLQVTARVGGAWSVESVVEYDYFIKGQNRSHNDDCDMDDTFRQESGSGYRVSVKIVSPLVLNRMRVTAGPFLENWKVDDSDVVNNFREPANDSTLYGLRVGVGF